MAALPGLDPLAADYTQCTALGENEKKEFLKERRNFKPMLGIPPLAQDTRNIETFVIVYEVVRKLTHILLVGRFFGAQEDLGISCVLSSFTDDAVAVARTAIEDTPESTQDT
jgi:hypothetical protein